MVEGEVPLLREYFDKDIANKNNLAGYRVLLIMV